MLVLTRKEGEAIVLTFEDGRTIRFEVAEGGPVRLAIEAPRSTAIARAGIACAKEGQSENILS